MKNSFKQAFLGMLTAVALAGCGGGGGGKNDENGFIRITSPTTADSYETDIPFPDVHVGGTINRPAPPVQPSGSGGSVGGGSGSSLGCLIVWPCAILSIFFKGDSSTPAAKPVPESVFTSSETADIASGHVTFEVYNETTLSGGGSETSGDVWSSTIPVTLGENVITVNAIDGRGYVSSDRIVVEITAPRYKLPIRNIHPQGFQSSEYYLSPHQIEIHSNSQGDSVIAWNNGTGYSIQFPRLVAAIYHPNSGWSDTLAITESPDSYQVHHRVSIDDAGNAMVVWYQDDAIHYRRYTPATGWTAVVQLVEANLYTNDFNLLTDPQGNAYLFWHDHSKDYNEPQTYLRYDAITGWSAPVEHTESLYSHRRADYSIDDSGIVSAIWAVNNTIYSARLTGEAGWSTPEQIGSFDTELVELQIEASNAGLIAAIWANQSDGDNDDYRMTANVYHPLNGWSGETTIASGPLDPAFELSVGIDADGRILAVWPEYVDDYDTVMSIEFSQTNGWGVAFPISRAQPGDARGPAMVVQESGQALVTWAQFDGWVESIVALEYDPVIGWGQTELIELNMAAGSRNPVIGTGGGNELFIAWEQYTDVWYHSPSTTSVQVGIYPL